MPATAVRDPQSLPSKTQIPPGAESAKRRQACIAGNQSRVHLTREEAVAVREAYAPGPAQRQDRREGPPGGG